MTTKLFFKSLALTGALLIAAWGHSAGANSNAKEISLAKVLTKLHATNLNEIDLGHLAAQQAADPRVKTYGDMLEKDHTAADAQVNDLLEDQKLSYANDLTQEMRADGSTELIKLRGLKGIDFDREFLSHMVVGHGKAIALVKKARQTEKEPKATQLFDELLPKLEAHQRQAQNLQSQLSR